MAIELTQAAVNQVRRMMQKHDLDERYGLRVSIKAGGCAGFEYALDLEEGPAEKDRSYELDGVKVFCDPRSYLYINGLTVDFEESLLGGGFVFVNPNATGACGCGTSFSTG